jgi:hypothetical protein
MRLDPEQKDVQYRSEQPYAGPATGGDVQVFRQAARKDPQCRTPLPTVRGRHGCACFGPTGYRSNFSITLSHKYSPIGMAEVAAGEGALHTCNERSLSAKRKSWTRLPSALTA